MSVSAYQYIVWLRRAHSADAEMQLTRKRRRHNKSAATKYERAEKIFANVRKIVEDEGGIIRAFPRPKETTNFEGEKQHRKEKNGDATYTYYG